ncbi:hypothetical protein [Sulfuracidifex metallicus]|uniref:Uncharacterized protein n=1 Tax=Sulfuracidifex metallicus DSM 6482 = JCM 9184 TaxID=523847 RepID=A0A6A9QXG4_SULME|nr:hypothetical protein [Sulfuracidifex metallicus]MUN29722.1 hypothetical protein [Sulfuracidifex metallicus DSM 6482 = JCM 9184]WOE49768.1 hypothetical protein RQ359_001249 [Sulfuracidifex metallicus DSM 6482 = JCM 9184]
MLRLLVSGFLAGLFDVIFYLNSLNVFAVISYHITRISSIPLGIVLHLIASTIIFTVSFTSNLILGIMVGSSTLALFSLPIHLLVFPVKIDITYVLGHVFYGIIGYLIYWFLESHK